MDPNPELQSVHIRLSREIADHNRQIEELQAMVKSKKEALAHLKDHAPAVDKPAPAAKPAKG